MSAPFRLVAALLFGSGWLIVQGLALALLYETAAVATGRWPTISEVTQGVTLAHPHWTVLGALLAGVILGGLTVHFTGWR